MSFYGANLGANLESASLMGNGFRSASLGSSPNIIHGLAPTLTHQAWGPSSTFAAPINNSAFVKHSFGSTLANQSFGFASAIASPAIAQHSFDPAFANQSF